MPSRSQPKDTYIGGGMILGRRLCGFGESVTVTKVGGYLAAGSGEIWKYNYSTDQGQIKLVIFL